MRLDLHEGASPFGLSPGVVALGGVALQDVDARDVFAPSLGLAALAPTPVPGATFERTDWNKPGCERLV